MRCVRDGIGGPQAGLMWSLPFQVSRLSENPVRYSQTPKPAREHWRRRGDHSIKVTVDIYGHLIPGANRAAVDRLDATGRNPSATEERSGATADAVTPRKELVELRGLEPLTPRLPALCSPN